MVATSMRLQRASSRASVAVRTCARKPRRAPLATNQRHYTSLYCCHVSWHRRPTSAAALRPLADAEGNGLRAQRGLSMQHAHVLNASQTSLLYAKGFLFFLADSVMMLRCRPVGNCAHRRHRRQRRLTGVHMPALTHTRVHAPRFPCSQMRGRSWPRAQVSSTSTPDSWTNLNA